MNPASLQEISVRAVMQQYVPPTERDRFRYIFKRQAEIPFRQRVQENTTICNVILNNPRHYSKTDMLNCIASLLIEQMKQIDYLISEGEIEQLDYLPDSMMAPRFHFFTTVGGVNFTVGPIFDRQILKSFTTEIPMGNDVPPFGNIMSMLPEFSVMSQEKREKKSKNILRKAYFDSYISFLKNMPKSYILMVLESLYNEVYNSEMELIDDDDDDELD